MKRKLFVIIGLIFNLLKGTLPQNTTTSLKSYPTYVVVGPSGDTTGRLLCVARYDEENPPYRSWSKNDNTLLTFDENFLVERFSASLTEEGSMYHFVLKIDELRVTDEGQYICQISINKSNLKSTVDIYINQYPITSIKSLQTEVMEGDTATVASCHADMSKPSPDMWFEDSKGNKIDTGTVIMVKECGNGLTNSTLHLSKTFAREDMDEQYFCKIKHVNRTEPITLEVEKVNVQHPPGAKFTGGELFKDPVIYREGSSFFVVCETSGYPSPAVNWTFTPAKSAEESEEIEIMPIGIPQNFILTDGNHRLSAQNLQISDDKFQTNNGTFTCIASNGIGSDASVSFELGVYAIPTTTTTTTPAQPAVATDDKNIPAKPEMTPVPQQAGPSAAVIAGIVAVAVFILIVTVILLLRYFMSHKGEYYTNELKGKEDGLNEISEEDDLPTTEEELLGEKKRTEHFL